MFDPVELANSTAKVVCRGDMRSYYRFRPARFYGGIATADCVGCCLRCIFCWSWREVANPERYGRMCSPDEVASNLVAIAKRKGFRQIRISGNEPTIAKEHLLRILELIPREYVFILETNGILIGNDETYAANLSKFPNLRVRVSLKGASEEEFSKLTGAGPEGFGLQIRALENLVNHGVRAHPACMVSFSSEEAIGKLRQRLRGIGSEDFEIEELVLYPAVEERLKRLGIRYGVSHEPSRIPKEQV
jgi:uncharacterized Fe-S cluster-containing radical SAM superfamily protein